MLEELGVAIDLGPGAVVNTLTETGMGFCLAPRFHPGLHHVRPIRRELGIGTVFNFLGPLANPARVRRQVIGVSDPSVSELMLGVLESQGALRAMVVFGHDGLDEITTTGRSTVRELHNGEIRSYEIDPTSFGIKLSDAASLKGGNPVQNADRVRCVLGGEPSAQADIVKLNAAAGLLIGEAVATFSEGVDLASAILKDGRAAAVLEQLISVSRRESETPES